MIEKNAAIEIRQVGNGFHVRRPSDLRTERMTADEDVLVFQSMRALQDCLEDHFTHRQHYVTGDHDKPK